MKPEDIQNLIAQSIREGLTIHKHDNTNSPFIDISNFRNLSAKYFSIATQTNGTTPVNIFSLNVPYNATITAVYAGALDTTAGTITVTRGRGGVANATVASLAKGGTAGVMTMAINLANNILATGDQLTVVSSSAGNAMVIINYSL